MTDTLRIDDRAQSELLALLRSKNYRLLVHLIDRDNRQQFRTEESGEAFESCVDWCAQNAGGLEDAKQVLLELFARFYHQLPTPVRDNLAYLAEEIGYSPSRPSIAQLRERSLEGVVATKSAFNVMVKQVQDYVAEIRKRKDPKVSVSFHELKITPLIDPSMTMQRDEQFILDVSDLADSPCRAGGPRTNLAELRKTA
jgi:hypothetical protein